MTYTERSQRVVLNASIAVMVLLNSTNDDMEMWPLQPHTGAAGELTSPEEFTARKLRSVGVVGLHGAQASAAFKEPLEPSVVDAIASAFTEYARVLMGVAQPEEQKSDEVAWLNRLYQLPDTRTN